MPNLYISAPHAESIATTALFSFSHCLEFPRHVGLPGRIPASLICLLKRIRSIIGLRSAHVKLRLNGAHDTKRAMTMREGRIAAMRRRFVSMRLPSWLVGVGI